MKTSKPLAKVEIIILLTIIFWFSNVDSARNRNRTRSPKPIVKIDNGIIKGDTAKSREGREYFEFLGIPFAKAKRFESPVPAEPWDGTLDAKKFRSECIQTDVVVTGRTLGVEDCLFLNVFTPQLKPVKPMPVMVYIHGGLFHSGSSNRYKAKYFMDHDIVMVSINYRLGVFGFLSTGDGVIRGNMGLRDQLIALQWVQQNIRQFGGDPSLVTLFGESAGAACVQYLMLSPFPCKNNP